MADKTPDWGVSAEMRPCVLRSTEHSHLALCYIWKSLSLPLSLSLTHTHFYARPVWEEETLGSIPTCDKYSKP